MFELLSSMNAPNGFITWTFIAGVLEAIVRYIGGDGGFLCPGIVKSYIHARILTIKLFPALFRFIPNDVKKKNKKKAVFPKSLRIFGEVDQE